ncbi:hypothetical protein V8E51_007221 [Hyaloscypha variabilis]
MKSTLLPILFLLPLALTQTSTPPCVASCETTSPAASVCDGTETGTALAQCECQSLIGTNLITCIKACPSDQISVFAAGVPSLCRDTLFPGVSVSAAATSTAGTGSGSGSGGATTTTGGTSSSTASTSPSATVKAGGGSNAGVKGTEVSTSFAAAFVGGVFALLML